MWRKKSLQVFAIFGKFSKWLIEIYWLFILDFRSMIELEIDKIDNIKLKYGKKELVFNSRNQLFTEDYANIH
jgi:hypothetical protein